MPAPSRPSVAVAIASALLAVSVRAAVAGPVPGEQIVYQCDFDDNIGPGFVVDPYEQGAAFSTDDPHSGAYCMSCRGNSEYYQYFGLIPHLPLRPGRTYRLSLRSRINDRPTTLVHVFFHRDGVMVNPPVSTSLKPPPSDDWQESELIFTVPPEFDGGELRFRFVSAAPEVVGSFDDLKLALLPPGLKADYRCSSRRQVVRVEANVADYVERLPLDEMTLDVGCVARGAGQRLAEARRAGLAEIVSAIECPIDDLPAGDYAIVVGLAGPDGEVIDETEMGFAVFRDPEWLGNELGMLTPATGPPPPWPPVESHGPSVRVWGRRYRLGPTGLPTSIDVLGKDLLAGPVRLVLEGQGAGIADASLGAGRKDGLSAVFTSRATVPGLEVRATSEIEFDGMLKYTLRLAPAGDGPATVDALTLQVPFRREVGRLLQMVLRASAWEGGLVADLASEPAWELGEFWPHIWIGSEDRGLAWFAETDHAWNVSAGPPLRTEADGDALRFTVTMIDTPTVIDRPTTIVFGLQATPTRPPHPAWADIRYRTRSVPANADVIWSNAAYDRYFGFPRAAEDTTAFEEVLASCEYPLRLIYLANCDDTLPQFRYYDDRWRDSGTVYALDGTGFDHHLVAVDHTDPLWQDFIVQRIHDWIERWGINGMYHDCFGPHTHDGRVQIFAFRELAKRVYTMHRRLDRRALTIVFAQPYVPCISFADAILSGEMYRQPLATDQWYPAFMSLAEFRAENVVALGPSRMILPQYKIAYGDSLPHAVHAMGIFLLHDLTVYASWFNKDVYDDLETRRISFGRARADFHGYWEPRGRVRSAADGLKVSYYEKPTGLLVTAANVTAETISSSLALDLSGLTLPPDASAHIYDPLTQSEQTITLGPRDELPVEVRAWMMVLIEIRA